MGEERPRYWRLIEDAFDVLLKIVGVVFLLWGVGIFLLVAWGLYKFLTEGGW